MNELAIIRVDLTQMGYVEALCQMLSATCVPQQVLECLTDTCRKGMLTHVNIE